MPENMTAYIEAVSKQSYWPAIFDSANKAFVLRSILYEDADKSQASEILNVPVYLENPGQVGYRARGASANITAVSKELRGQWKYAEIVAGWAVDKKDIAFTQGKDAVISIVEARTAQCKAELVNFMITEYLNAQDSFTNAESIEGLRTVMSTSVSNGQLSPTTYTNWKPNNPALITANTATSQDLYHFIALADSQWPGGNKLMLTTPPMASKVAGLVNAKEYITHDNSVGRLGFKNYIVHGIPLVAEGRVTGTGYGSTDTHLYVITTDMLRLAVNPNMDMDRQVYSQLVQYAYAEEYHSLEQIICLRRNAHTFRTDFNPAL